MEAVKLKDIADHLNTSIVTVSNALSGKKGVSDSMRNAVFRTAEELGYDVSKYQLRKKEGETRFGVLLSEKNVIGDDSYEWMLYQQVVFTLSKNKISVLLKIMKPQTKWDIDIIEEWGSAVDGLLLIGRMEYAKALQLEMLEKPVVLLGFGDFRLPYDAVVPNDYLGVCRAVGYLLERGHEELSFVYSSGMEDLWEWYSGFCRGMEEYGKTSGQIWMIEKSGQKRTIEKSEKTWTIEKEMSEGKNSEDIVFSENMPTAFVCAGFQTAGLLREELEQKGYRIPQDVSVIVYDRMPAFSLVETSGLYTFTYCTPDLRFMAEAAVDLLLRRKENIDIAYGTVYIDSRVVNGKSVKDNKVLKP